MAEGGGGEAGASSESPQASRRRIRKPGTKWDGRVSGLSLKEYREMKWGTDAAWKSVQRGGPKYSLRPMLQDKSRVATSPSLLLQPAQAFDRTKCLGPSFSMGALPMPGVAPERSPGIAYNVPSTMDPKRHPTIPKHTGGRIGTEMLSIKEEDGPAPGDYDAQAFFKSARSKSAPKFTVPGREAWLPRPVAPDPGPGEYQTDHCSRTGKNTPIRWTAQGKTEPLAQPRGSRLSVNPGPGQYPVPGFGSKNEDIAVHRSPKWRFGSEQRGY